VLRSFYSLGAFRLQQVLCSHLQNPVTDTTTNPARHRRARRPELRAIQVAQVAVPANGDGVDEEQAVLVRDELEVEHLHKGPDHPVGGEGGLVAALELGARAGAFQSGHGAEEDADHDGGEEELVGGDAGEHLCVLVGEDDPALEEVEPGVGYGAEDGCGLSRSACDGRGVMRLAAASPGAGVWDVWDGWLHVPPPYRAMRAVRMVS